MPPTPHFVVVRADWLRDEAGVARVRREVFIEEQGVPESLEWEPLDAECVWFIARIGATVGAGDAAGEVIGVVRLTPDARIGRMAVRACWRRRGLGAALLAAAMEEARRLGYGGVRLSAQTHALPFYARFGFRTEGGVYQDAGIPHVAMSFTFKDFS